MSKRSPGYFSVPRFAVAFLAGALEIGGVAPSRVPHRGPLGTLGGELQAYSRRVLAPQAPKSTGLVA